MKPSACVGCSLYETGEGFAYDEGDPARAELIFIGEALGKNEVIASKPFVGDAGFVLKHWGFRAVPEVQMLYEQGKVCITNTLRCLPPKLHGRAYPQGETKRLAEAHCRVYDTWRANTTAPVVLLGEVPQRYHFDAELTREDAQDRAGNREVKGVTGRIGRVYERDGRRWIFAPHPAFVLRQPALVEHLQIALRIAVSKETPVQVEILPWGTC